MLCSSYIAPKLKTWSDNGMKKPKLLLARMGFAVVDCQQVSAADKVYGVTTLLESFMQSDGTCTSKQFGVAYDALSLSNLDRLKSEMQQAIKIQRDILRKGSTSITKSGCIRSGRKFMWVKLEDSFPSGLLLPFPVLGFWVFAIFCQYIVHTHSSP
ncbi:uncharacterized protein LOC120139836 [Hibiscus syriacus]|uniref:uncharacterized protein LOC120139836 n=1 Tax=Hibiscus syriacus TaxID=106335 RepID=UPI001922A1DA|nr:uncharacterized protein LOC120139836 [Hibiscus syriacus]